MYLCAISKGPSLWNASQVRLASAKRDATVSISHELSPLA
jgi:hypothetical protein